MVVLLTAFLVVMGLLAQERPRPPAPVVSNGLSPAERTQLEREEKLEGRIRIYETASVRYFRLVQAAVKNQQFDSLASDLQAWIDLCSSSLKDVVENIDRKRKSKALIRYEIHLRKAIMELQDFKPSLPVETQDLFDRWLAEVEDVRKRFIDLLFMRERS